jgi:hypothetical protein
VGDFDPVAMLRVLVRHRVDFIVVGGVAARLRGAPLLTQDIDITPATDRDNLARLAAALDGLGARLRSPAEPQGVAFPLRAESLEAASMWTLITRHGDLDLVMTPSGTTGYRDLARDATEVTVAVKPKLAVVVASLADVIRSKEAAGRDKDRAALPLLRRTLEETEG